MMMQFSSTGPLTHAQRCAVDDLRRKVAGACNEHIRRLNVWLQNADGPPTIEEARYLAAAFHDVVPATYEYMKRIDKRSFERLPKRTLVLTQEFVLNQVLGSLVMSTGYSPRYLHNGAQDMDNTVIELWRSMGLARWAHCGFPVVLVDEEVAANIVATSGVTGPSSDEEWKDMPWRSFMIAPCDTTKYLFDVIGLVLANQTAIACVDPETNESTIDHGKVQVCIYQKEPDIPGAGSNLWVVNYTIKQLLTMTESTMDAGRRFSGGMNVSDVEQRRQVVGSKLVAGVSAALCSDNATVIRKKTGKRIKIELGTTPPGGVYVLGLPIRCKIYSEVASWVRRETKSMTRHSIKWMVRGHYRNQAYGTELHDHRRIWIAPYWKGPERGSTLVRTHVIEEPSQRTM